MIQPNAIYLAMMLLSSSVLFRTPLLEKSDMQPLSPPASPSQTSSSLKRQEVVIGPDGTKTLYVKWPVGSSDHIITFRVPFGFVEPMTLADCFSFGNAPNEQCSLPYEVELLLRTKLPDFSSVVRDAQTYEEDRPILSIFLRSALWGGKNRDAVSRLKIFAQTAVFMMGIESRQHSLDSGPKSSLYGLQRIGLIHHANPDDAMHYHDILFEGDDVENTANLAICTDLSVPTMIDDPKSPAVPLCQQYFAVPELSATVQVRYERQHLQDWRAIKAQTITLLKNFQVQDQK